MKQGILKTHDLDPDGVRIVVKWEDMATRAESHHKFAKSRKVQKSRSLCAFVRACVCTGGPIQKPIRVEGYHG